MVSLLSHRIPSVCSDDPRRPVASPPLPSQRLTRPYLTTTRRCRRRRRRRRRRRPRSRRAPRARYLPPAPLPEARWPRGTLWPNPFPPRAERHWRSCNRGRRAPTALRPDGEAPRLAVSAPRTCAGGRRWEEVGGGGRWEEVGGAAKADHQQRRQAADVGQHVAGCNRRPSDSLAQHSQTRTQRPHLSASMRRSSSFRPLSTSARLPSRRATWPPAAALIVMRAPESCCSLRSAAASARNDCATPAPRGTLCLLGGAPVGRSQLLVLVGVCHWQAGRGGCAVRRASGRRRRGKRRRRRRRLARRCGGRQQRRQRPGRRQRRWRRR